jgi:hypothetical protein
LCEEAGVLFGRQTTVRQRVTTVLLATAVAIAPALVWWVLAAVKLAPWPRASDTLGVAFGLLGGAIILFEMAMAPAKWLRGHRFFRVFGATKAWLKLHVWLGLAVLPVIMIHSGFNWGGPLSAVTMVLFLLVIASGVWGLVLQQWLPVKMLDDIPTETVASQIESAIELHRAEARGIVSAAGPTAASALNGYFTTLLDPYLKEGRRSQSPLASATESARLFTRLRSTLPRDTAAAVDRLERLADLRRLWDRQARLNWWLHSWLVVHLPLSVAMSGLMIVHAVLAMKWW